jgi:hypothetical protein
MMIENEFRQGDHQLIEQVELMTGMIHGKDRVKIKILESRKPTKARQIPIHAQDQDHLIRALIQANQVRTQVDRVHQEQKANVILMLIKVVQRRCLVDMFLIYHSKRLSKRKRVESK